MMNWPDFPEAAKIIPGALGSLFSMLWLREVWGRMVFMFLGGVAFAYYATSYVAKVTGFDEGITGFLLGLFGMSMVASVFAGWLKLDMSIIIRDALRALLRLPPAKDAQ